MKAVLMSIQPKWCELIASGNKTVEIRKTKPKLDVPFKVYIYETKGKTEIPSFIDEDGHEIYQGRGQVIGEFICDRINKIGWISNPSKSDWVNYYCFESCLFNNELYEYTKGDCFYEWNISNLIIYDKPKELSKFTHTQEYINNKMNQVTHWECGVDDAIARTIKKAPQSWYYVEELKE